MFIYADILSLIEQLNCKKKKKNKINKKLINKKLNI